MTLLPAVPSPGDATQPGQPGAEEQQRSGFRNRRSHPGLLLPGRKLGVVGEINYHPFDATGKVVDRRELRPLARRVLSVTADRLHALSRLESKYVIAVAGGRQKITAIRGALNGRFLNVLITDEDTALALVSAKSTSGPS